MFDVHIDYLFYKKFVGQPEFILNLYAWIYLYIFENYEWIILWAYWICFEKLWQVMTRSSVWYLVLSKEQSYYS